MTCEIDRDFYCTDAVGFISNDGTSVLCAIGDRFCGTCKNMHRKWPTPEQFKEEWGAKWTGAVYSLCLNECASRVPCFSGWTIVENESDVRSHFCSEKVISVCACTPWPKPDSNWRPS